MAIDDIRVKTSFRGHRKRRKLAMLLGREPSGTDFLLDLWIATSENHCSGILLGMSEIDIALEAGWEGDPGEFVKALVDSGFLEKNGNGAYQLHDWEEHQGWVYHSKERSERARQAARARWGNDEDADSMQGACGTRADRNAPSPNPSPSPIPYQRTVEYLNEKTGRKFSSTRKDTQKHIKARWNDGFREENFRAVIDNRCAKWLKDKKMSEYLRPQTLFGTKFEAYLNDKGGRDDDFASKQYKGTPREEIPWADSQV